MAFINLTDLPPFLIYQNEIFAPVRVNQISTLAQLDTGANIVSISPQLAEGLPRVGKTGVGSAFDQKTFELVEKVEIEFLGQKYQTTARVFDNPSTYPFDAGVVLSSSIVYGQPLILDFRLLHFAQPHQMTSVSWNELEAIYLPKTDLCLIRLETAGKELFALFDTGAGLSVVNSIHLPELELSLESAYDLEVGDATGAKATQSIVRCSDLSINGLILPPFDCFPTDLKPIEDAIGHRIDLIIGTNLLLKSGLRWLFDKPAGKVFVAE